VSDMVARYEQEHYAIEPAEPKDALRFLIEARGLKQEDLASVVPQSNLSAILAGKRKISATLAGKLGNFFGVSPALFIPH
jgi:HTH-type transcriptional regulator / antitoxin HigA